MGSVTINPISFILILLEKKKNVEKLYANKMCHSLAVAVSLFAAEF